MPDRAQLTKLLSDFIADETLAFAEGRQGSFWPSNHHRIKPAATQAACLAPEGRVRFYFHYMRVTGNIPGVSASELPHLVAAYRELLPHLGLRHRIKPLFCFGFDEHGPLSDDAAATAATFPARLKALAQCDRYASLPAQRANIDKFRPFGGEAEHILLTFRRLGYRYSGSLNLTFWGLALIALLDRAVRTRLVSEILDGGFDFPEEPSQLAALDDTVRAVLPECDADEAEFRAFAARLSPIENVRQAATAADPRAILESIAFAQSLSLPFADEDDWTIEIRLPEVSSTRHVLLSPDGLILEIRPKVGFEWMLTVHTADRGRFSERAGKISGNDLGIDALGMGNLANFPAWLKSTREKFGLAYRIDDAFITCGRKRSAVKLLNQWLASQDR